MRRLGFPMVETMILVAIVLLAVAVYLGES
jgi:hypothetical protein